MRQALLALGCNVEATNEEYIPGADSADKAPKAPYVPWAMIEEAAKEKVSLPHIDWKVAEKLIAERELAYKYNEGYVE